MAAWAAALLFVACSDDDTDTAAPPFDTLSEYGFFVGEMSQLVPAPGVIPYAPVSPLWADFAEKGRFIVLPPGQHIDPSGDEDWDFPLGTMLVKTFFFDRGQSERFEDARVVETRLMIREQSEHRWSMHTYVWNEAQTQAWRTIAGARITIDVQDDDGNASEQVYLVPNTNQCRDCHARNDVNFVLGLNTLQLDYESESADPDTTELGRLVAAGLFGDSVPLGTHDPLVAPDDERQPIDRRARSYLHANCAHCHRRGGDGGRSGLDLTAWQDDPSAYGVCKGPVAAGVGSGGRRFDIVPGRPDESIIPFRMATTDPEIRMPEIPSRLSDDLGVELVRAWIAGMEPAGCL